MNCYVRLLYFTDRRQWQRDRRVKLSSWHGGHHDLLCTVTNFGWQQLQLLNLLNKKHLKNVGPIRHCEPLHCHAPGVATVARRLRIDVHNDDDNNNDNDIA